MFGLSAALVWAIVGVILIIVEVVSVSFVCIFFGIGAILTAFVALLIPSFMVQVAVFAIVSVSALLLLRKGAQTLFCGHADMKPEYLGQKVNVSVAIPVGGEGKVDYRGSSWIAMSDDPTEIPAGSTVEITGSEGIRFKVKRV